MRIIKSLLICSLLLILYAKAFTQDKVYFISDDKDGKTESLTASTLTYTPNGKKEKAVAVSTKKLILLFNKSGDFLSFEKLDFSSEQTKEAITHFLNPSTTTREKDQVYSINKGRIDDKIITEDKNYLYVQGNAEKIDKKTIVAVVYKDGHHILYAPAEKAALILWENKPALSSTITEAKTEPKKELATPVVQKETVKPTETKKDTIIINANAATAQAQKPVEQAPATTTTPETKKLTFEDVAGNVTKAEFEKKALQKTNQLNIYLKVICNKSANYEEINKAIDQSITLFVDENAMIETSSLNRNDVKRYKIRSYLSHIKLVNYDKIEIEWTNVQYVSDVKQGPDGNYYGVVSFEQVFRGYRDGKLIYQDVTRKNATVVLKTYEKNVDGNIKNVWDVLLSDIGVISTKSL
jgi:hypothetical protein